MASTILGIDMGTQNIKISSKGGKSIICEKNVIAMNGTSMYAFGDDAYDMFEKTPDNITVSFPVKDGVIADYRNMRDELIAFIHKYFPQGIKDSTVIVAIPTDISEVEKRSYFELVESCKFKLSSVRVCEIPLACAIGLGLPVNDATGMMVIDFGADTTEISVISLGGLVLSKLVKTGGNKMAECIASYVKENKSLYIGAKSAESLLCNIGFATEPDESVMKTIGRNMLTGYPVTLEISAAEVYEAIKDQFDMISEAILYILERTPPELSSDIIENGIYLTGGVSKIKNLDKFITGETELSVNLSGSPIENAAKGLEKIASDKELSQLAYTIDSPKNRFFR